MANTDKDILITPNRGQSNDPKIEFSGATAGSASTITMIASPKADGDGTLDIQSSDNVSIAAFSELNTGSLMSVSDESGVSRFDVNETGVVNISQNSGALGLPVGVTTERPPDPKAGFTRWNTDNNAMEIYTGNEWVEVITDYFPNGSTIFNSY